jgi:hypothetical protein
MHNNKLKLVSAQPIARFAVPLDENGFVDWLIDAEPGDAIAYYRGHLAHDRMPKADELAPIARRQLHAVAARVMAAHEHELLIPVQKRIGPEDYLYIAVKARFSLKRSPTAVRPIPSHQCTSLAAQPLPLVARAA